MMKYLSLRLFTPLVLLAMTSMLSAQLALQLKPDKQRYLCYEPITVTLTVSNISGNTLEFGGKTRATQGNIHFQLDRTSGRHSRQFSTMLNPAATLKLAPGESKALRIILNQHYDMQQEDNYTIRAVIDHGRLPRAHISETIRIEVSDGLPIAVRNIGLPSPNKNDVIKAVKLTLMRFTDTDEDIYCMRAEDEENVYAVFRLGSYIDGEKPQMEIDDSSLLHVLLQIRPRLFTYFIFGFEGRNMKLLQKRFYVSADGAPPTLSKATGYLRVEHARLARKGIDYIETEGLSDVIPGDKRR